MDLMQINGSVNMIGAGLAAIGSGIGVGLIFASVIQGTARQPEAKSSMMSTAWIGMAIVEALFILALAFAFVIK